MKIIIFISRNIVIELAKYNLRWTAAHGILHHVNNYFTKIRQQSKSSVKKCKIKYKVRTHNKITNLYLFLIQEICFLMPHLCKRQCDAYNHWLSTVNSYQMCAHLNVQKCSVDSGQLWVCLFIDVWKKEGFCLYTREKKVTCGKESILNPCPAVP